MKHLNYYKKQRKSYKPLKAADTAYTFEIEMKIIENIRTMRLARGFTQEQLAARLNIDVANYSRIERGIAKLTVDRLEEIARILDLRTSDILNLNLAGSQNSSDSPDKHSLLMERNNQLLETMLNEVKDLNARRNHAVTNEMKSALETQGFFRLSECRDDLLNTLISELGTVLFTTDVVVKPESNFLVTSAKGLDYHTDHHKADYILWYCVRQTDKGGESILIDAWKAFDALSDSHKEALHEIRLYEHKIFPDDLDSYPLADSANGTVSLYYSFWLLKKEDRMNPALLAFQSKLREITPIKVKLSPADILVIDNHRIFHGRTPIEGNRDRFLKRFWIAKENIFPNHKNQ